MTAACYVNIYRAHIARIRLEACGIPCYLDNENLVGLDWYYASAVGGAKLNVPEEEFAEAREALIPDVMEPEMDTSPDPPGGAVMRCIRCRSMDVYRQPALHRVFLLVLLGVEFLPLVALWILALLVYPSWATLFFVKPAWKCLECGCEWDPTGGFPVTLKAIPVSEVEQKT
ncbi:MAG: hypothetical protein ACHRHE_12660 [Tepidisphaerales bacterium]